MAQKWGDPWLTEVRQTYEMMLQWGDEPRRARLGALLGEYLVEAGELVAAAEVLASCKCVSNRLQLAKVGNDLAAAIGRLYLAEARIDDAVRMLDSACVHHQNNGQWLLLAQALLPRAEAAMCAGDTRRVQESLALFDSLLPLMPGLALAQARSKVRMFCGLGAWDDARGLVAELRALGHSWHHNVWIYELAGRLDTFIGAAFWRVRAAAERPRRQDGRAGPDHDQARRVLGAGRTRSPH